MAKKKKFDKVKDSGENEEFSTGSVRDNPEGKGRFDLTAPYAMFRIARHYENGSDRYGDRNWELGQPLSRYLDSAERHLTKIKMGLEDEDHLSAACWNLMAIIETQKRIELGILPKELDNLPTTYKDFAEELFPEK